MKPNAKAFAAVLLKTVLPLFAGSAVLVLVIAWLAGFFQEKIVAGQGEVAGRPPADAIVDMQLDRQPDGIFAPPPASDRPVDERTWFSLGGGDPWSMPAGYTVEWAGEGEWKITLDVFRDLGLAFAAALVGIFVILMFETRSRVLPLVIMLAIPLTLIGIMPGF